jgi:hypothetical protein
MCVQMMQTGTYTILQVCIGPFPKLTAIVPIMFVLERTHFQFTIEHFEVMVVGNVLHTRKLGG